MEFRNKRDVMRETRREYKFLVFHVPLVHLFSFHSWQLFPRFACDNGLKNQDVLCHRKILDRRFAVGRATDRFPNRCRPLPRRRLPRSPGRRLRCHDELLSPRCCSPCKSSACRPTNYILVRVIRALSIANSSLHRQLFFSSNLRNPIDTLTK